MKYALLLCLGASVGWGAVITSGTFTFLQPGRSSTSSNVANFVLSDGVAINVSHTSDGPTASECRDSGSGCNISALYAAAIGNTSAIHPGFYGFIAFDQSKTYAVVPGLSTQTITAPFSVTGGMSYDAGSSFACPFPEGGSGSLCSVSVTGTGTATYTVSELVGFGQSDVYYISRADLVFATAPEPETLVTMSGCLLCLALLRQRRWCEPERAFFGVGNGA